LLTSAQCGVSLTPDQGEYLAEIVTQWQANPGICAKLGQRARVAYEQQFTFESALARWEEVLRQTGAPP